MSARESSPRGGRPGAVGRATVRNGGDTVRRVLAGILVLAALAPVAKAPGAAAPPARARGAPYPTSFPAGAGQAIADRACLFCHSPMLVTQQAKDSTGWEKTLALMEKWGAPATAAEHDTLRRYLLAHFGPRAVAVTEPTPRATPKQK